MMMFFRLFLLSTLAYKATSSRIGKREVPKEREQRQLAETPWMTIFKNDFETGVGTHFSLPNTGDDAAEHEFAAGSIGANSGNKAIRLRDSGIESIMTSTLIDVSLYDQIEVSFYYRGENLEAGDKFIMEFQNEDAGSWRVAKDFVQGGGKEMNGKWSNQVLRWILHDGTQPINSMRVRFQNFGDNSDVVVSDNSGTQPYSYR